MSNRTYSLVLQVFIGACLLGGAARADEKAKHDVTLRSTLREMVTLENLTRTPSPPYVARQASSYDRASRRPGDEKTWFANADRGHFVRVIHRGDRKEHVMLDVPGPGVVTRIWSANPAGTLRVYVDKSPTPALEAPMADLLRGKVKPFVSPLAYEASRGCNIYFPFGYSRHCMITSDKGGFYYQVGYRTYDESVGVEPFSTAALGRCQHELDRVVTVLSRPSRVYSRGPEHRRTEFAMHIQGAGSRSTVAIEAFPQGAMIREIVLRPSRTEPEILRRTLLALSFDGEETVLAPLGDFFGSAPGVNPYDSVPLAVAADGRLECRWPMPFRKNAVLELRGTSAGELRLKGHVVAEPFSWGENSLLFGAGWQALPEVSTDPPRDWNYVEIEGNGVYAGNVLTVANPVKAWWGEGDEKIYVDGEKFPSHFGTGTEDYYGYAWCCPEPFVRPYHSQTRCDGPGNFGYTSVNRWHILDAIPFRRSLRFDMEIWHWNRKINVGYAAVSYWYARPGARSNTRPLRTETLRIPALPERKVKVIAGAIEGETMNVIAATGVAAPQELGSFEPELWSRDRHLWWRGARPGDRLQLAFSPPRPGRYRIIAYLTKAPDYGIHRISVNGQATGKPVDLYHKRVVPAKPLDLGVFDLRGSANRIEVKCTGTNFAAKPKNYMFGLDCIVLQPVTVTSKVDGPGVRVRRLAVREYADRMKAGWIGQMVGVGWGGPTEFKHKGTIIPADRTPEWKPSLVNQFHQDDLYVEMTFLRSLELHGYDVSLRQAGIDFARSGYPLWHANRSGRDNLRRGVAPPDSGHPRFNKHADDIDYQIEADFSGLVAPGLPNTAIALGETFGRLMNYGDGVYGGQFVGGLYAAAFFESDPVRLVEAGLACIPAGSQYAETIRDVLRWHREHPDDWRQAWKLVDEKYHRNSKYRRFSCSGARDSFNIDAKLNGAYIALGLLYGKGDPDQTIIIAMRCGQDSDCNPSNAGGVLFTTIGYRRLPERFTTALDPTQKFTHTLYDFPTLVRVCEKLARDAVTRAGGAVERDSTGEEVLVIPVEEPRPAKLERSWKPGPVAGSRFSAEELVEIREALQP